jgi:GDP-mannose 6-dehydrogenase
VDVYDPGLTPDNLVGQNLGYAYTYLPTIDTLLVDRQTAQSRDYDLIVATNKLIEDLSFPPERVMDVSAIA